MKPCSIAYLISMVVFRVQSYRDSIHKQKLQSFPQSGDVKQLRIDLEKAQLFKSAVIGFTWEVQAYLACFSAHYACRKSAYGSILGSI